MHCIVLVKQVPDVANIPEDAWDTEHGTLRRAMLESILNPLDLHALTFAHSITADDPEAKTVYLTMGPPQAREMLLDCLSRVPGEAILLTDRAFAGADTIATAYALGCAIRRVERELFDGSRDYVIVAGMQSVDGDTAQVPPQIAQELGLEQIAYVRSPRIGPGFELERIGPSGTETVRPRRFPVLVTLTDCTETRYRSFHLAREARRATIREWDAASVGAEPDRIGLRGSRTQVTQLFSPREDNARSCVLVQRADELVELIASAYRAGPHHAAADEGPTYALNGRTPTYTGEFWVYAEHGDEGIRSASLALLGKARQLADLVGAPVGAVLAGESAGNLPRELIACGADRVYRIEHPLLAAFIPSVHAAAVAAAVRAHRPQVLLFGATPLGRELAPRVAHAADCGLTADCTRLELGDHVKGSTSLVGVLKQTRPALGGNVMATILTRASTTQMATVRPGVFGLPVRDAARVGEVVDVPFEIGVDEIGVEVVSVAPAPASSALRDAEIVVAGGRGLHSRAEFETLLPALAGDLGALLGARSEVGASRMAVEEGWAGRDHQVGQTGQTVAPRLYLALGISGAVQHVSGMQRSDIVVAVNRDPRAQIFRHADLGIVGDVGEVVPELIRAAEERAAEPAAKTTAEREDGIDAAD
jgi:electron transfer flavoprotein alpha subunit